VLQLEGYHIVTAISLAQSAQDTDILIHHTRHSIFLIQYSVFRMQFSDRLRTLNRDISSLAIGCRYAKVSDTVVCGVD
jgi:hypothetical protein